MKKLHLLLASAFLLASCGGSQNNVSVSRNQPSNIQAQVNNIPGFDVNNFSNLLKSTSDPAAIEAAINSNGNNINNLDLDNDGSIDYLKVNQVNNNSLEIVDETGNNQKVTVATLNINTGNNSYSINGAPDYCGTQCVYNSPSGLTFGQYLFLSYMLTPRPYYYHSTWGYHSGYYGSYHPYHSHYSSPYNSSAVTRTRTIRNTTTSNNGGNRTPSQPRQAVPQKRSSLSSPSQSQRSPQTTSGNNGGPINSAFGKSSPSSSSSSRSSFGSSHSGFGGSSHSSGRHR